MLFSSGDFSFLLTLSSLVSVFSFLMVALKIETTRSCKGVSLRMMECPLVLFSDDCSNTFDVLRCFLMTFPLLLAVVLCYFDVTSRLSGDLLLPALRHRALRRLPALRQERRLVLPDLRGAGILPRGDHGVPRSRVFSSFLLVVGGVSRYFCRFRYTSSYDPSTDNFQHHWLALGAFGLCLGQRKGPGSGATKLFQAENRPETARSLIFHPNLNDFLPSDISWAFALYLESVAAPGHEDSEASHTMS